MKSRKFTIEAANRTLPLVQRVVTDIVHDYEVLSESARAYKSLRSRTDRDADREELLNELKAQMARISERIDGFVAELTEIGCEMKDLEKGLVDFPAELDGRSVYLCWRAGEDRVDHWHGVTEGFSDRRPLPVSVLDD